ncbi:hypothetical protein BGZ83_004156 [Gryganskiella cystojenkinii]|nr:hypothetical protein BGZ83_004156 [Gryganskiella cystojenkinii]
MEYPVLPGYDSHMQPSAGYPIATPTANASVPNVHPSTLPGYTAAPLPNHKLATQCCCISLSSTDKLRLINMPRHLVEPIRQTIRKSWGTIQRDVQAGTDQEFKLSGNPWDGMGYEAVKARRLVCQIMKTMAERGWNLIQTADISKHEHDKDSMFFESQVNGVVDQHVEMFAISFNRTDCIRLIDAPQMIPLVRATIQSHWRYG